MLSVDIKFILSALILLVTILRTLLPELLTLNINFIVVTCIYINLNGMCAIMQLFKCMINELTFVNYD